MRSKIDLLSSGTIDLMDEIPYSLNFAIADIREPDKRNASFSKTIAIPGSKTNNKLFTHIFEIGIDSNFNPNRKAPCILYVDELSQIQGFLQLLKINKLDDNKIEYQVSIKGNVGNIFVDWAEGYLTDLDLSAFNHTYNKATQKASWAAAVGSGYVYPMIDYGMNNSNGLTFDVENFFPAVYVKQYIDSAFALAGYTYESSFFDSDFFKRLIIPYNSTTLLLSESQLTARYFKAKRNADYIAETMTIANVGGAYIMESALNVVRFDTDVSDVANQYNTSTYRYTVGQSGSYILKNTMNYSFTVSGLGGASISLPLQVQAFIGIIDSNGFLVTTLAACQTPVTFETINNNATSSNQSFSFETPTVVLGAGQSYCVGFKVPAISIGEAATVKINIKSDSTFENKAINTGVFDGDPIDLNNAIPKQVKIKDFFTSIIKMFNLYIETDKSIANKLYIEPRNDFYVNGTTVDWTDKLAIDKELEINPMGELNASRYVFKYKEDKDFYNSKYQDAYQEPYGTRNIDIDTDFVRTEKKLEIIFSPTPLSKIGTTDRIIPQIVTTENGSIARISNSNIRILYYGGVKNTSSSWSYTGDISGTTTETTYPYAGHVDEPLLPTLDLSFGVPRDVYYDTNYYTNNNLFNKYYKKYLDEITDKDSKIITGYFYLTPKDIYTLDFRNQFLVDTHLLRLNKIYDYNPLANTLTKCEFIKIKEAAPFVPEEGLSIYGNNISYSGPFEEAPTPITDLHAWGEDGVFDNGNVVDPTVKTIIITGSNNYVGEGSNNISILASSGVTVMPNITNVTLINSNNVLVTESNTTYVNGVQVAGNQSEQGIIATPGGGQLNAYQTTKKFNLVETVASTGDSVKTVLATLDQEQQFKNVGANSMNVYPKEGERFRRGTTLMAVDAPYPVASRNSLRIYCYEPGIWTD